MAIFLAGLAKGLITQGAKKAATSVLKNAAKDKIKSKAKEFISNKKKKEKERIESSGGGGKKGGALVRALDGGGVSAIVKSSPPEVEEPKLETEGNKIDFEKINIKIENIVKISGSIDDALKGQYQEDLERRKKRKAALARLRRRRREKLLEGGKKALDSASGVLSSVGKAFNIMDFIKNILIGGLLLFLLKNFKKIVDALNFIKNNAYILFASLRAALEGFKLAGSKILGFLKSTTKGTVNLVKNGFKGFFEFFKNLLKKGGSAIGNGLRRIGNALFDFGAAAIKRIKDLARAVGSRLKNGVQAARNLANFLKKTAPLAKLKGALSKGGKFLKKSFITPTAKLVKNLSYTRVGNKLVETAFDARLALREGTKKVSSAVKGKVSPFLRKFLGEKTAKEAAGAAPFLKKLKGPLSKIKIPILGPAIVLAVNLLDPDVSAEESIFRALGTAVGEILGTLIPIPILGTLVGGIVGEYGGSLLYTLFRGGGITQVQQRIKDDFMKVLDIGKEGWKFISGGFSRLTEKILSDHSFEIPNTLAIRLIPIFGSLAGMKIPDPRIFFDLEKMGSLLKTSFFPDSFDMPSLSTPEPVALDDTPKVMTENEFYNARVEDTSLPDTYEEYKNSINPVNPLDSMIPDRVTPIASPAVDAGDADLFQRLVLAESQGEGKLGMALVARSVLNRLGLIQNGTRSPGYFMANDDTLRGVIYGPKQYQPTRDGSIDRPYSATQKAAAQEAINLAKDPDALKAALINTGVAEDQARLLLGSTGFRTVSASYDASQDVNVVKFKNHLFNTAGNTNLKVIQPVRDSAMPTQVAVKPTTDMMGEVKNPQETDGNAISADPPKTKTELGESVGNGEVMGTTNPKTQPINTPVQITRPPRTAGSSASSPMRNVEQYPSYDVSNQNIIILGGDEQMPMPRIPSTKRSSSLVINQSTNSVLNSYYKRQLLGLLYKVG